MVDINRQKNPNFSNPSAKEIDQTIELFHKHGYIHEFKKDIIKIPFHKWNAFFDAFRLPLLIKNIIFLIFEFSWVISVLFKY